MVRVIDMPVIDTCSLTVTLGNVDHAYKTNIKWILCPDPVWKGAVSVAFVRPSVCLSTRRIYIANNSRTQRPSVPKFGRKISHLIDVTRRPVSRSKIRVARPILMLTHIVRHIFRMARPTNFKLGIRMDDDDPHQPQVP